ncbi:hypothetical protein [uncultured Roseovarius sp.]|uniref:hypothetical protein n=1 Tax=uncultured Roseovarius sp. TaxID=293344 RepID=UPI002634BB6E|nr:hypothetical protein [uncultured Roseovarius sp.]
MSLRILSKSSALLAAMLIANSSAAAEKNSNNGLFGFKGAQATVTERANSRNRGVAKNSQILQETKKKKKKKSKKKRKRNSRRGSYN